MCGSCGGVLGVLVLVAGISMLGYLPAWVAGAAFVLYGLGKLVHVGGMCPMCKK